MYKCTVCTRVFTRGDNLNRHMKCVHKLNNRKPSEGNEIMNKFNKVKNDREIQQTRNVIEGTFQSLKRSQSKEIVPSTRTSVGNIKHLNYDSIFEEDKECLQNMHQQQEKLPPQQQQQHQSEEKMKKYSFSTTYTQISPQANTEEDIEEEHTVEGDEVSLKSFSYDNEKKKTIQLFRYDPNVLVERLRELTRTYEGMEIVSIIKALRENNIIY